MEKSKPVMLQSADSENYFSRPKPIRSSSDSSRREYHDQLATMLFGKKRKELSVGDANKVSNFAAYLTGNEEYVDTW